MNAPRKRSLRSSLTTLLAIPIATLIAIWGFAAGVSVGDGLRLFDAIALFDNFADPAEGPMVEIREERVLTARYLSRKTKDARKELGDQRVKTDRVVAAFVPRATSETVRGAAGDGLWNMIVEATQKMGRLRKIRSQVDAGDLTRLEAYEAYNRVLDPLYPAFHALVAIPDVDVYRQSDAIAMLEETREMFTREHALVAGAAIDGRMTRGERAALSEAVAARRLLQDRGIAGLHPEVKPAYDSWANSAAHQRFTALEDRVVRAASTGGAIPTTGHWNAAYEEVHDRLTQLMLVEPTRFAENVVEPAAVGIIVRAAGAGGIGLVAVAISIWLSTRFGRRLTRELARLRDEARNLAGVRLPRVVARLSHGEDVDVASEAPPFTRARISEVHDVGQAFASVQQTAVQAAVGQAELRKGVGLVFRNLARRSQSLLQRQLNQLDEMQRRTHEPDMLEDLFKLDHLTTRMRRHAEGLIILSGAPPGRGWRKPVPVVDVLRAATTEVEEYRRVLVSTMPHINLAGPVVADIIHLLAELVENATIFSPPDTQVHVRGELVRGGFAVEIEDEGLGMSPMEFEQFNARVSGPMEFSLADSERLGLFIVGRLAARHGIRVMLRPSRRGGTSAVLLIPEHLVSVDPEVTGTPESTPALTTGPTRMPQPVPEPQPEPEPEPIAEYTPEPVAGYEPEPRTGPIPNPFVGPLSDPLSDPLADPSSDPLPDPLSEPVAGVAGDALAEPTGPDRMPEPVPDRMPEPGPDRMPDPAVDPMTGRPADPLAEPASGSFTAADLFKPKVPPAGTDSDADPPSPPPASNGRDRAQAVPEAPASPPPPAYTETGLPRRIRQQSLAPQLRADPRPEQTQPPSPPAEERSPEDVRALVNAFRAGWRRGADAPSQFDA